MRALIDTGLNSHLETMRAINESDEIKEKIIDAAKAIISSLSGGGRLLICGNGGSAADSQHIATELVSRFYLERQAMDAEALTVNTSTLTAIGNDYSFDNVFARQVEAKGRRGDVLLGISTSGGSKNVVAAIESAKKIGMKVIGMVGEKRDCPIARLSDIAICVPSKITPRIQEAHITIAHIICEIVERDLAKGANK